MLLPEFWEFSREVFKLIYKKIISGTNPLVLFSLGSCFAFNDSQWKTNLPPPPHFAEPDAVSLDRHRPMDSALSVSRTTLTKNKIRVVLVLQVQVNQKITMTFIKFLCLVTSYVQSHDLKEVIADVAVDAVSSSLSSSSSSASLAIETAAMSDTGSTASTSDAAAPMSKSKPNRCAVCKKRVGLTGLP